MLRTRIGCLMALIVPIALVLLGVRVLLREGEGDAEGGDRVLAWYLLGLGALISVIVAMRVLRMPSGRRSALFSSLRGGRTGRAAGEVGDRKDSAR